MSVLKLFKLLILLRTHHYVINVLPNHTAGQDDQGVSRLSQPGLPARGFSSELSRPVEAEDQGSASRSDLFSGMVTAVCVHKKGMKADRGIRGVLGACQARSSPSVRGDPTRGGSRHVGKGALAWKRALQVAVAPAVSRHLWSAADQKKSPFLGSVHPHTHMRSSLAPRILGRVGTAFRRLPTGCGFPSQSLPRLACLSAPLPLLTG